MSSKSIHTIFDNANIGDRHSAFNANTNFFGIITSTSKSTNENIR